MKLLIKTNAENWDESQIVAQGLMRDGYQLVSVQTSILARDLPESHLTVWRGIVESLRGDGISDGGRVCIMAEAELEHDTQTSGDELVEVTIVKLTSCWQWDDGRMTTSTTKFDSKPIVDLVRYLLDESSYV